MNWPWAKRWPEPQIAPPARSRQGRAVNKSPGKTEYQSRGQTGQQNRQGLDAGRGVRLHDVVLVQDGVHHSGVHLHAGIDRVEGRGPNILKPGRGRAHEHDAPLQMLRRHALFQNVHGAVIGIDPRGPLKGTRIRPCAETGTR